MACYPRILVLLFRKFVALLYQYTQTYTDVELQFAFEGVTLLR